MELGKVLFDNEYYQVVTGKILVDKEITGKFCYQVVNKDTDMVEYEDIILPAAISVADQCSNRIVQYMEQGGLEEVQAPGMILQ